MNEKLFLGCGPPPIHPQHLQIIDKTWICIDLYVDHPEIVKMDACKLEYPDNSIASIYTSHLLEHIELRKILPTLSEWYRVLKPDGELIINVPDIEWAAEELGRLCNNQTPRSPVFNNALKLMEVIYGNQDHEGEYHKSGFTQEILEKFLEHAGFKKIIIERMYEAHEMQCLIGKAIK